MELAFNEPQERRLSSRLKLQIGLAFFSFILIGINDGAVGVLLPSIRTHYNVDKATVSLLFLAVTLGYLTAAFSTGWLVNKLGQRLFLMLGPAVFVVGAFTVSLMPPFAVVALGLLAVGFGVGVIDAGINAYIAGLPGSTALLNYLHAFYGIGALLGPIVASTILAIGFGWNVAYFLWVGFSLIVLVSFAQVFKIQNSAAYSGKSDTNEATVKHSIYRLRAVWLAAFFLLFYVGVEVSIGNWSYSFLTEERHEPTLLSGWAVSGYWLGLTLGRLVLGKVGEKLGNKRLIQLCLAGAATGVLLIWVSPLGALSAVGLSLTGFSLGPIFPTTIALMPSLVPARLLPGAIGFLASLGSMGGAFFPWLAGNLAEHLGLWTLMPYAVTLDLGMLIFWFWLQGQRHKDKVASS